MGSQKSAHLLAGLRGDGLIVSQIPSNSGFQEADMPILGEALRGQGTPHALGQPGPEALPARMKRSVPVLCTNLAPRTLGP